jgi:hypothetical protein
MLALSGAVLLLFGFSWWTALVVVLLLACPAAIAVAVHVGFRLARSFWTSIQTHERSAMTRAGLR